ncbi:MAG: CPBP family intramembrane metalloprotease [Treponema sp.]|nr:CPBP family intramembrane metalloprotease [Treponema sp.]
MKQIFKFFLLIPVLFALLMCVINILVLKYIVFFLENSEFNSFIKQFVYNIIIILSDCVLYFFMYRFICYKCSSSSRIWYSIKQEWVEKIELCKKIKEDKLLLILIVFLLIILQVTWFYLSDYIYRKLGISPKRNTLQDFSYLFIPIFEEFIFRKLFFDYCDKNPTKHIFVLNVMIFAFAHLMPMPTHYFLGIILTYCYIKYKSILLNTSLHVLYNFLGLFLPPLLNYIKEFI